MVTLTPTAFVPAADLAGARALMDLAFHHFDDHDWEHALGGLHATIHDRGTLIAHGSVVLRRLLVGDRALRCGYVEAVAVHPDHHRRGLGSRIMAGLESLAPGYDLMALSASERGAALYAVRGWRIWRGPSSVVAPSGLLPTPDDDGGIHVLGAGDLDLDAPIACDWREGEVW